MRTFQQILQDVARSCNNVFCSGYQDIRAEVLEAATRIYLAELQINEVKKND